MKLASLRSSRPDGQLVVVSQDGTRCVAAGGIAPHLQAALDSWDRAAPALAALAVQLDEGSVSGQRFDPWSALAPLPRAYQWIDGAGYMGHLERVRLLKSAQGGSGLQDEAASEKAMRSVRPLLYQGASDSFSAPSAPIIVPEPDLALDFAAEVAVIIGPVPMRPSREAARAAIRLVTICNDVSLRRLVVDDLQNGFGFFHAKPATAFAPLAVTPDSLGAGWRDNRLHLPVRCEVNGVLYGQPNAGTDVHFDFLDLIVEAARTRSLAAGTIIGSGTIANRHDQCLPLRADGIGFACIAEARTAEQVKFGRARTPYLKPGDRVRIAAIGKGGQTVFGDIDQAVGLLGHGGR